MGLSNWFGCPAHTLISWRHKPVLLHVTGLARLQKIASVAQARYYCNSTYGTVKYYFARTVRDSKAFHDVSELTCVICQSVLSLKRFEACHQARCHDVAISTL